MKGLWIKDFRIIKAPKVLGGIGLAAAAACLLNIYDAEFLITFLAFFAWNYALSTIAYDQFDNGEAFLFTLPVTKAGYVIEKYGFTTGMCLAGFGISTILYLLTDVIRGREIRGEVVVYGLFSLAAVLLMQTIVIPLRLKYGSEKGRLVVTVVCVILVAVTATLVMAVAEHTGTKDVPLGEILGGLQHLGVGMILVLVFGITAALLAVSAKISIGIMEKKEF